MILSSVAFPTIPTPKIRQDRTVLTYLNKPSMYVLLRHAGGSGSGRARTDPFPGRRAALGSGVMRFDPGVTWAAAGSSESWKLLDEFDWQLPRPISRQDTAVISSVTRWILGGRIVDQRLVVSLRDRNKDKLFNTMTRLWRVHSQITLQALQRPSRY